MVAIDHRALSFLVMLEDVKCTKEETSSLAMHLAVEAAVANEGQKPWRHSSQRGPLKKF
ncbi:hypothetical protein [Oryza sativa Japonica Group]|uniref:Uncharacterized protein n=1 Tax=Oryza sativa subsp. japonica TaxID=39947 RepID=Q5JLA2_ORYSJ|nr:hypothetical protein [Oryza sativa Japonica Group]